MTHLGLDKDAFVYYTLSSMYNYPLYRYCFGKFYILLTVGLNQAEVGIVKDSKAINDFMLWTGIKTIQTFTAATPRKAYNKAKQWVINNT